MSLRPACLDVQLLEDLLRVRVAVAVRAPLRAQPLVELVEAVVGVEHATYDQLRRDRPVPTVLLQSECDVVAADTPVAVSTSIYGQR